MGPVGCVCGNKNCVSCQGKTACQNKRIKSEPLGDEFSSFCEKAPKLLNFDLNTTPAEQGQGDENSLEVIPQKNVPDDSSQRNNGKMPFNGESSQDAYSGKAPIIFPQNLAARPIIRVKLSGERREGSASQQIGREASRQKMCDDITKILACMLYEKKLVASGKITIEAITKARLNFLYRRARRAQGGMAKKRPVCLDLFPMGTSNENAAVNVGCAEGGMAKKKTECLDLFPMGTLKENATVNVGMRPRVPDVDWSKLLCTKSVHEHRELERAMFSYLGRDSPFAPKEVVRSNAKAMKVPGKDRSSWLRLAQFEVGSPFGPKERVRSKAKAKKDPAKDRSSWLQLSQFEVGSSSSMPPATHAEVCAVIRNPAEVNASMNGNVMNRDGTVPVRVVANKKRKRVKAAVKDEKAKQ